MVPPVAARPSATQHRSFGRTRLLLLFGLLGLLAVCFLFAWLTRGAMADLAFLRAQRGAAQKALVDTSPWQTAQTLAALAVTAEEQEYARAAEHLADHEVDQAFAAALRTAALQTSHRVLSGRALVLSRRAAQLQAEIVQDTALVNQLKAKAAPATPGADAAPDPALQVAQAQLALDSDELSDTQRDLGRATGDLSVRIQQELASHEAGMKQYDSEQRNLQPIAVVSVKGHTTLSGRIGAWFNQRSRYASIEQALAETANDEKALSAEYKTLEAKLDATAAAAAGHAPTLAELRDRSADREILSIDDDRIQTDKQLETVYSKWGAQVLLQHTILLHLILQSLIWILAIACCILLGDVAVRRLLAHPALDRRQAETLRSIFVVGVEVVGIFLIVMVVFGPPKQTATMIGIATAAITITLQDYLLAFLGWFFLIGRNGLRVGDLVQINNVCGEVIEIGLMSTTLLETTGLNDWGEPTGRRVSFLNSFAISGQYFNFSSEGQWMWDEITVSVPAGEDIYALSKAVESAVRQETADNARAAEAEWQRNVRVPGRTHLNGNAVVSLRPSGPVTDKTPSVDLRVRYVTRATDRFKMHAQMSRFVIRMVQERKWLTASEGAGVAEPAGASV